MLTKKQIKEYFKSPYHCPYCNSEDIEGGDIDFDDPITQRVNCPKCGKSWKDTLKVADILEN